MDEQRLQRIEDKIDRLAELAVNSAVMQNEILTMQKQIDEQTSLGKERSRELEDMRKEVKVLRERLNLVIKVGGITVLAVIGIMTGVNLL